MDWTLRTYGREVIDMSKRRPDSLRRVKSGVAALSLLALALILPAPLRAGKKKDQTPPAPANTGNGRMTGYFDTAKIVWPGPPEIPRIAFKDLYTGEKIDPSLYTKKAHKTTWMDRLAGTLPADQVNFAKLPFQLIRLSSIPKTRVMSR